MSAASSRSTLGLPVRVNGIIAAAKDNQLIVFQARSTANGAAFALQGWFVCCCVLFCCFAVISSQSACSLPAKSLRSASWEAMTKAEQKKAVQFTRMCKFWQTNECKMGADCTFAHDSSDLRPSPKPCFDFAKKGVCTRGDACRFVHQLGPKAKVKVTEMHNATFQMIRPDIPSQLTMPVQTLGAPRKFALNSAAAPWFPRESDAVLNQFPQAPPGLDQIPLPKSLIGGMPTDGKDEADVCSTSSGDSSLGFQGGL